MKKSRHVAVSAMLGILMSWAATASNAAETAPAAADAPAVAIAGSLRTDAAEGDSGRTAQVRAATPLASEDLLALQVKEAQSPELLQQSAAGCRNIWNNDTQRSELRCINVPFFVGAMGAMGALVGSTLNYLDPVAGAYWGAAGGLVFGLLLTYDYIE